MVATNVEDYTANEGHNGSTNIMVSQGTSAKSAYATYNPPMANIDISAIFCFLCIFMLDIRTAGRMTRNRSDNPLMMPVVDIASLPKPSDRTVSVSWSISRIKQVPVHSRTRPRSSHQHQRNHFSSMVKVRR